ncbi:DUF4913 domain-containing protein [Cryobacterium psychrophilum]|uniref:DUF4913 domain-containing protein n=1 Tax=Cryobacterium psychrophilum TaxID=41988 RepID=A0A4Y8KMX4_9MICO|nr:DUF4913 domain-containing protein [Cryobacterium psychrophilum]
MDARTQRRRRTCVHRSARPGQHAGCDARTECPGRSLTGWRSPSVVERRTTKEGRAVSEFDDLREDDNEEAEETETPQLFYGSSDEFVRDRLRHMDSRRFGPGNASFRWSATWWHNPEALARIDAL